MINVSRDGTVRTERNQDLGTKTTNVQGQLAYDFIKILPVKLTIGIVQNDSACNSQNFTSGRKLFASHNRQFLVICCAASIARSLPRGEADYAGLDASIMVEAKRATKASCLIVGMGGDAHQPQHAVIVA